MYDKLDAKVNSIGTSRFDFKIKYNKYKSQRENRIPDTSGLVKKTDYNVKINETAGKKTSISGLATNTTLTVVENKILSVSNLVKKKQIMRQTLLKLKRNVLIIIMINILQLQSLIL